MALTDRQEAILAAIRDLTHRNGYPPTVREIGAAVGLSSPASVQNHLRVLERNGYIRRGSLKRRALEEAAGGRTTGSGRGQRGGGGGPALVGGWRPETLLALEQIEDVLESPEPGAFWRVSSAVKGSSMVQAGI